MIQQISNGDRLSVGGKIGKDFRKSFVVAEFSVVDEHHDGHGGELLGEGGEAEVCPRVDLRFRTEVAHPVRLQKTAFSPVPGQDGQARIIGPDKPVEYWIDRNLSPLAFLTSAVPGDKQEQKQHRARYLQKPLSHGSPHFGSKSISLRRGCGEFLPIGQAVFLLKGKITYFVNTVFNYPTLAECYKAAAFNGLNRLV